MENEQVPQTRKIPSGFDDEMIEVGVYQSQHRPQQQELVAERFPLNPTLRAQFDNTPNEQREALEVEDWWDLPFILTDTWEDVENKFRSYQSLLGNRDDQNALTEEQIQARLEIDKAEWRKNYPEGVRYEVRCLDGGAWDRSTHWGTMSSLASAIGKCEAGPVWRQKMDGLVANRNIEQLLAFANNGNRLEAAFDKLISRVESGDVSLEDFPIPAPLVHIASRAEQGDESDLQIAAAPLIPLLRAIDDARSRLSDDPVVIDPSGEREDILKARAAVDRNADAERQYRNACDVLVESLRRMINY